MDGGRYKLTKAAMDQSILGGLSHKLIGQLFLSVCRAKIVGQTIQVDMSGIDTGLLPDRKMVWQLLGAPNAMEENHDLFRYAVNGVIGDVRQRPVFPGSRTQIVGDHISPAVLNQLDKGHVVNLRADDHYPDCFLNRGLSPMLNLVNDTAQQATGLVHRDTHHGY